MAALASLTDLELVAGFEPDAARGTRLLEMASAAVRRYIGRSFDYVEDDVVVVRTNADCRLRLPNGPVSALTAINGPVGGDAVDLEDVDLLNVDALGFVSGTFTCGDYTVTYTHGYDPIPDDVVAVVCDLALARLSGGTPGMTSESLGDYSASWDGAGGSWESERAIMSRLDNYRVTVGRIPVL